MTTVTAWPEDERALTKAIGALEGERAQLENWGAHSVELALAIDDLVSLRDRIKDAETERRRDLAANNAYPLRSVS